MSAMGKTRVNVGRRGEALAAAELTRRGFEIAARNWRCDAGEVDIVARRGDAWTFFEVRTRRSDAFGAPEESLTPAKRQRMIGVALTYLAEHDLDDVDWQVGFVAVEMGRDGRATRVEVYESIA